MDEAGLCDRVALIQAGRLLQVDTPAQIEAQYERPLLAIKADRRYDLIRALRAYSHAHAVYAFGESLHYTDARPEADEAALRTYLYDQGFGDIEMRPIQAGIEDAFMELMSQPA
jgi:ABC-type multidrug transport system ATPase subunit